ncbi:hypothetical protein SERLA73DRAFT_75747 [Serpula lacrymans var. lacrymans S7.3]|uniref:START domain-containing protein n=1 Tax=Serpula lacrymans var. lacrymans (strain S7.3) TaxID=936435 RepID=F8Q442_SERL3|nr:hypothetical protein SERLA73DRAFT_75747 [Serpula lacrymans var. lacrymans S7.3]
MSDGTRLRQSWYDALNDAEAQFRQLLTSCSSSEWKHVSLSGDTSAPSGKGKSRASAAPELADVVVHRKPSKLGDYVYRAILEVPIVDDSASLDSWKAIFMTPEIRQDWDPAVEGAQLVEMIDQTTRIVKTNYTIGWPANPRDAVTISRLFHDTSNIIDISTSLPRSPDEPAYLRPSPPYVRSSVKLFAWCVQHIQPPQQNMQPAEQLKRKLSGSARMRITCFWQHDLRAIWNFGSSSTICQQLCTMMVGLYKAVKKRGTRVPTLMSYGYGVSIERIRFQLDREALTVEYAIHPEDEDHLSQSTENAQGLDVGSVRERRQLTRSIEYALPSVEGWDVQVSTRASSEKLEQLPWTTSATRKFSSPPSSPSAIKSLDFAVFRISHASLPDENSILKVKVVLELSGPSSGIRLNGLPQSIQRIEERDPSSFIVPQQILQDVTSIADLSLQSSSSISSANSTTSTASKSAPARPPLLRTLTERSAAADKSIFSRVKRSYIYFSSLMQEPEAKWKRTTEARGVSITQLDSIDPTLVVYRAEATFVGLGLWDLYGALASPGARVYFDKQHEDAVLLEDVNELTELWHFKTKPAWPVNGRDAVLLKTVYKSPTTIHVFSFSADELHLFPNIPPAEPNVIRTQVDLQGWAIEALSPNTTQLTLLEQSDPKGWSNKASIPQQMINAVAGVGEFTIKCGGPPVVTRLSGARTNDVRYDHERGTFRIEYEGSEGRRMTSPTAAEDTIGDSSISGSTPTIECELRCDIDTWASSLDIVIDPPPQNISCLRRHRLSAGGGGLWLTLGHDALFTHDERLLAIVRRGPITSSKDKGTVMVNGARVTVDVEELPEQEIKALSKRKRIKPPRIPLDQPPVMSVIRRRREEWDADGTNVASSPNPDTASTEVAVSSLWPAAPRFSSPLSNFFTTAMEQATMTTQQAVAAISPSMATGDDATPSSSKPPMQHVLEALSWIRDMHTQSTSEGWTLVSDKGLSVHRKLSSEMSPTIPIHKGEKVIEGVAAEEVASVVTSYDCRKQWDDRFDSATVLENFGAKSHTAFVVSKSNFPFRDRGFYLSSVMARARLPSAQSDTDASEGDLPQDTRNVIFCVSASFNPESVASFSPEKYNPYALPIGRMFVDGWMLETLDPYTTENFAIPSTRCTRIVAVDYAGSIPTAVNSLINSSLPRAVLAVETYVKNMAPLPTIRLPTSALVLADKKNEEAPSSFSWKLLSRDENRTLISSNFDPAARVYSGSLLLTLPSHPRSTYKPEEITPKPAKIALNPLSPDVRSSNNAGILPPFNSVSSPTRDRSSSSASVQSHSNDRLRSSTSSAFTIKGEVKYSGDLLVAEYVVDSKLYPEGYDVQIRSRNRDNAKYIPLQVPEDPAQTSQVLPIAYAVYTVPSSPLHSSGLNADRPPRHLLRLTLPTAQYQISTVQDPLTEKTHSAPPKPQWLLDLQDKGVIVEVEVKPAASVAKRNKIVKIDGGDVAVATEKESLTSLGRDELQDDRVSKMSLLFRTSEEGETLPDDLKAPIAIADHLLNPVVISLPSTDGEDVNEDEGKVHRTDEPDESAIQVPDKSVTQSQVAATSTGRFLSFLNSYPLSRLASSAPWASATVATVVAVAPSSVVSTPSGSSLSGNSAKLPEPLGDADQPAPSVSLSGVRSAVSTSYPLSTVIIIALIAFLIGSLLRSLLSPADFIYVATDIKEAEEAGAGWREIRRLLEVKYIVGGWDFQIAVVRRH